MSVNYYNEITILKAVATLFITFFHFKWSVPHALAPLFIGGAIGNSIFFFCSGYLLSFKVETYPGQWMAKKYFRIMPAVWVTLCILSVFSIFRFGEFRSYSLQEWLFPDQFWFVRAILTYYIVTYVEFKLFSCFHRGENMFSKTWLLSLIVLALIVHIVYYLLFVPKDSVVLDAGGIFCWMYWYAFFLAGSFVRHFRSAASGSKYSILGCLFSIAIFFFYKRAADHYGYVLAYLQFILVPLLLYYIVFAFRRGGYYLLSLTVMSEHIKKTIIILSNVTLEVYLVQWFFINWIMPVLPFPLNLLFSLVVIFSLACFVHVIAGKISAYATKFI